MRLEVGCREGTPDMFPAIIKRLNEEFNTVKVLNPRGHLDEFESRLESILTDIVVSLGGTVVFEDRLEARPTEQPGIYGTEAFYHQRVAVCRFM